MNRQQFIANVRTVQEPLRRFLTGLCCGDSQLADDIAQDTLIKAYTSLHSLSDEARFQPWVFRIAYHPFISYSRTVRPTAPIDESLSVSAPGGADDAFRYQDLYAALNRLSEHERSAVLLFYMQGYSTQEAAQILEIKPEAVRQLLSRARTHLRNLLPQ